jgi:acyl-CoA thioesterase I
MKKQSFVLLFSCMLFVFSCGKSTETIDSTNSSATFKYLALGDSYTKGEAVSVSQSFPFQLLNYLYKDSLVESGSLKVIAETGWTTTELKTAIAQQDDTTTYNLVTLLIGANNIYRNYPIDLYEAEFQELLQTAIRKANNNPNNVIVISIPDYGYTPFGKNNKTKISAEINKYNAINKTLSVNAAVRYVDITPISRQGLEQPVLIASDNLHPSAVMYALWVGLLAVEVKAILE